MASADAGDQTQGNAALDTGDADNELSFRAVQPVHLDVNRLTAQIDTSPSSIARLLSLKGSRHGDKEENLRTILKDVSAHIPSGTVTAIIGSSGSGKTSVLNCLSHRIEGARLSTSGSILYNGSPDLSSVRSAYVMQQDVLIPTLTVRETLRYSAELRLPPGTTRGERYQVVEDVIIELGLKECADTRIGNNIRKGCSGGEKRRCSLAVQMLANPSLLFLDEVTTGLDAATAFQLVRTLKNLARKGRTVVVTIHQPRSEIWSLFDNVLLLAAGSPVYSGPVSKCLPYFQEAGHEMPPFVNPAEFLIDLAAIDVRTPEGESLTSERVHDLIAKWKRQVDDASPGARQSLEATQTEKLSYQASEQTPNEQSKRHAGLIRQVDVLTRRTIKVSWRDPMGIVGIFFEAISLAIITGWIFLQLDGSQTGIRSREGAVYVAASLQGYLILLYDIYRLTIDIQVFDRELGEGVTTVPAFIISRRVAHFLMEDLMIPMVFSVIFYFMVGFRSSAAQFFQFYSIVLLMQLIAVNLATVCIAVSRDFAVASFVANMAFTLQSLGCGYFVQANQIPVWMRWLKWCAYTFYAFGAMAANEFVAHTSNSYGQIYDCPATGGASDPACEQYTGRYIMTSLGLPSDWISRPIWVLLCFALAFFFGSGVLLHYRRTKLGISRARQADTDLSAGKEEISGSSRTDRKIAVRLTAFELDIRKRGLKPWHTRTISVLKSLDANFEPGIMNVIMG